MVELDNIFAAYYDCRKNKRNTANALQFEVEFERKCIELWKSVNDRTYHPVKSIAFIVTKPMRREIFAADFSDRVLHHLIDLKLRPLLEKEFIDKTFNNRKGKGTAYGVKCLYDDIKAVSENHTKDCWIAKLDMRGFFMSISKSILIRKICQFIDERYEGSDKEDLKWLVTVIIGDHPEKHCVLKSPPEMWRKLDRNKSLFWVDPDRGIPIGNLISQLMANFFLNEFDHFVTDKLGFRNYGRYVDDFYIIDTDKQKILNAITLMRTKLAEIGITLHPHKFYFQHYTKGVKFTGTNIKFNRIYVSNRTVNNAFQAIRQLNKIEDIEANAEKFASVVNSYLGFMKHYQSYAIRRNLIEAIDPKWFRVIYVGKSHLKVIVKKKFKSQNKIKERIKKNYQIRKNYKYGRFIKVTQRKGQ
jgi:RNA-directed DNA polymerase